MSNIAFELDHEQEPVAKIKVIGVGGAGGNAIRRMIEAGLSRVEFIAINTDEQVLHRSGATTQICIGANVTKGLGAGGRPEVGKQAIEEDRDRVADALSGADMVFITAGMGGGTGTGASPVVAELAREVGALTVGVVTTPFAYEQAKRLQRAQKGLDELREHVDNLIVISNERLRTVLAPNTPLNDAFREADNVLRQAVQGITDIILVPGLINLDFADVRTVMSYRGDATMGSGICTGENAAKDAAERAISSPLLEDVSIAGAKALLVNITSHPSLTQEQITDAMTTINAAAGDDADVYLGVVVDENVPEGEIRITVIATGFESAEAPTKKAAEPEPEAVEQEPSRQPTAAVAEVESPRQAQDADREVDEIIEKVERIIDGNAEIEELVEEEAHEDRFGRTPERPVRRQLERTHEWKGEDRHIPAILRRQREDDGAQEGSSVRRHRSDAQDRNYPDAPDDIRVPTFIRKVRRRSQ